MSPIVLCPPKIVESTDDAGITIIKSVLPDTTPVPAPYESVIQPPLSHVPSLAYFSVRRLIEYPDAVHCLGGPCLRYHPPSSRETFDIIRALIPPTSHLQKDPERLCLCMADPRLWALLVQVYYNLPKVFWRFIMPLRDKHLPMLNRIPSSSNFAMITVLELPRCSSLTDDTISELKALHGLCAFDASETTLTSHGVQRLSWSISTGRSENPVPMIDGGPWRLRILRLQGCNNINDSVFSAFTNFPLLCVIDLRGTKCTTSKVHGPFRPSPHRTLFHPVAIAESLENLIQLTSNPNVLFPHSDPFIIHVNSLSYSWHPPRRPSKVPKATPDIFTFPPVHQESKSSPRTHSNENQRIIAGNSELLIPTREFHLQHELQRSGDEDLKVPLSQILKLVQETSTSALDDLSEHMNAIAEIEGDKESSVQALRRFYGKSVNRVADHQCPYTKSPPDYSGLDQQPSRRDKLLMLYRDPPPWSDVSGPSSISVPKPISRDVSSIARVDRKSIRAHRGRDGILSMIAKRIKTGNVNKSRSVSQTIEQTQSINPFIKKARSSSLTTKLKQTAPLKEDDVSVHVQTPIRPLKPISSLPVPPPPPQPKKVKIIGHGLQKQTSKQMTLPGMFFTSRQ